MDWILVIKVAATVILAAIAVGLIWVTIETTSQPSDPGTGY